MDEEEAAAFEARERKSAGICAVSNEIQMSMDLKKTHLESKIVSVLLGKITSTEIQSTGDLEKDYAESVNVIEDKGPSILEEEIADAVIIETGVLLDMDTLRISSTI